MMKRFSRSARTWLIATFVAVVSFGTTGCHNDLFHVTVPYYLFAKDLNNPDGIKAIKAEAWYVLHMIYAGYGSQVQYSGLFTDELHSEYSYYADEYDMRKAGGDEWNAYAYYGPYARVRTWEVIEFLKKYAGDTREKELSWLFSIRANVENSQGEEECPGDAFNELINGVGVQGDPLGTKGYFEYALKDADSAVKYASPDSTRDYNWAHLTRARILLNLGRFSEAAAEVASIPTSYQYILQSTTSSVDWSGTNYMGLYLNWYGLWTMGDREGVNGLPYVTGGDPRVKPAYAGWMGYTNTMDSTFMPQIYVTNKDATPMVLSSGIDARLIEAEALLAADHNDASGAFLQKLNSLRADSTNTGVNGLAPLSDPGTYEGRLKLLLDEQGWWQYLRGRRLGNIRRAIRFYGVSADAVLPTGRYALAPKYGSDKFYGTATNMGMSSYYSTQNKKITGCTRRTDILEAP